jgi:CrcB protein
MMNVLLVAAGGALGAAGRYGVSAAAMRLLGPAWPWGTFAVNAAGSLLIGLLAGWLAFRVDGGAHWRLFLGTGVLGGFTTFSAFSLETFGMIERKQYAPAAIYALGSVAVGLIAVFIGLWIARRVFA